MIQELSNQELKDVTEVMLKTRIAQKPTFFSKKQSIIYTILIGIVLFMSSISLAQLNKQLGQFCLMLALISMAVAAYIFFYIRGLKKNIRQMVSKKIGKPIEVKVSKDFIRYNGKSYAYKNLDRAFEYHGLMYLTFDQNFMVVKNSDELMKCIERNSHLNYVRYKKPFNLFSED